ncbi:MAG: xanthine phosphoribosyltransferase [Bacteroidales bacterium]|nr:xanthine phosphoribosyltransferase [Bacteroidales bacterium]
MNFLEEKIITDGKIFNENILKVDGFLNHQIDMDIMRQIACEIKRRFKGVHVDKILTIEASGIAIAVTLANMYDVPVVFAKKSATVNSTDDKYVSEAYSFTRKTMNKVFVSKPYLHEGEDILIVDDFIADGQAANSLVEIVKQAGANIVGIGVAIEKGQQNGGKMLREKGFHVESIAIIDTMNVETQTVFFRRQ